MIKQLLKPVLITCIFAGLLAGCSSSEKKEVQTIFGYSMGTSYSVKLVAGFNEGRNLQLGIEGVLANINSEMSTYLPNSDLSKFGLQKINEKLIVDQETAYVVSKSLEISNFTQGNFDPTIAPLVDLWGFGPTARNNEMPDKSEIEASLKNIGYKAVAVDLSDNTLIKTAPRELDLSAIAKGYAVDQVAEFLEVKGFSDYLVEVGGEMRISGHKPENQAWRIAIEKPVVDERAPFRTLSLNSGAIATSGDYRNYFEFNGQRFSHTIDPKTGYPVDHDLASVTVLRASCMEADALATAFMVMGKDQALEFAHQHDIATFIIYKENETFLSVQSDAFTKEFGLI